MGADGIVFTSTDEDIRGIGALICEKFAAEGSNVAVNYMSSKERADQVADKCKGFGVKVAVIQAVRKFSTRCHRMLADV